MHDVSPDEAITQLAADRWRLWCSLLRGLSHQLANVAQMLALDPVPAGALAESRERIADTMAALNALREASGSAPVLIAPVLADLDRLQRLQMEFPSAPITCDIAPGVPALAVRADDLLHALLACVTAYKRAAGERRVELVVAAHEDGAGACVTLSASDGGEAPSPGEAVRAMIGRAGGEVRLGAAIVLWLPAWRRPGFAAPA